MRNRTEREEHRGRSVSPFDFISWQECDLVCSRCKKKLLKFTVWVNDFERVQTERLPPIIERAIHMHQCTGSLVSRLMAQL